MSKQNNFQHITVPLRNNQPFISIVIPTYNEEADIRPTLDAAVNLDYPYKEIIVVDDSTDETTNIIKEYQKHGVRLICRKERSNGCCGARNLGMEEAKGEIVVLLNADVRPQRDFLNRILLHYESGADYVLVWQKSANDEYLFPRYIEAEGNFNYSGKDWIEWTEGFSCRRQAALDVGLIPGNFPIPFCRDWLLGKILGEKGFRKVIDTSIIVYHVSPYKFGDFWRVRKNRGRFAFLFNYFIGTTSMKELIKNEPLDKVLKRYSLKALIFRVMLKTLYNGIKIFLIFPALYRVFKVSKFSPNKQRDIVPFLWASIIEKVAFSAGEWSAYFEVCRYKTQSFNADIKTRL